MKKKILLSILLCASMVATIFTGCGEKNGSETTTPSNEVESTTMEETTTIVEETTSEEVTNEVEEPTSPSEEATSEAPTTEEPTTIVEETTTSKVEETTKAPEPTTQAPTQAPTEAPTPAPTPSVDDAAIAKIKSLHIAYRPEESNMVLDPELCDKYGGFVFVPGENYRVMADYVDEDCGDGTKPNPYTMYEWTERKYWGDRDEVTVGFYCYKEDIDNDCSSNGIIQTKAREFIKFLEVYGSEIMDGKHKDDIEIYGPGIMDGCNIKIGTYEGRDIYFEYYFLKDLSEPGSL